MLKFLLAAAIIGSLGGAGGGTLAAKLRGHGTPQVPRVKIALGKPGPANRLAIAGVGLAAGDRMQRPFDLNNTGGKRLSTVAVTASASVRNMLSSDRMNGLQLRLTRCTAAFQRRPAGYICPGRTSTLLTTRPVLVARAPIPGLAGLAPKASAHLLLTLVLPAAAPNILQGQRAGLTYTFTAA